jgi:hypothetical protein
MDCYKLSHRLILVHDHQLIDRGKACTTQNYWGFGLCPLYGVLRTLENTMFWKVDLFASSGESGRHVLYWIHYKS